MVQKKLVSIRGKLGNEAEFINIMVFFYIIITVTLWSGEHPFIFIQGVSSNGWGAGKNYQKLTILVWVK